MSLKESPRADIRLTVIVLVSHLPSDLSQNTLLQGLHVPDFRVLLPFTSGSPRPRSRVDLTSQHATTPSGEGWTYSGSVNRALLEKMTELVPECEHFIGFACWGPAKRCIG